MQLFKNACRNHQQVTRSSALLISFPVYGARGVGTADLAQLLSSELPTRQRKNVLELCAYVVVSTQEHSEQEALFPLLFFAMLLQSICCHRAIMELLNSYFCVV